MDVGCSVSGVVKGLPWAGRPRLFLLSKPTAVILGPGVKGKIIAEVEAVLVSTGWPPILTSLVGTFTLMSTSVMVP